MTAASVDDQDVTSLLIKGAGTRFLLSRILLLLAAHLKDCFLHAVVTDAHITLSRTPGAIVGAEIQFDMTTLCRPRSGEDAFWRQFRPQVADSSFLEPAQLRNRRLH